MDKEELEREARINLKRRFGEFYPQLTISYVMGAEPREKQIEELRKQHLDETLASKQIVQEMYKQIQDLQKENAELKKNYEDSLVACGVLKNKVELLAQPSPLESMQDVLIATQKAQNEKQSDQLTKAKEHIKRLLDCLKQDTNDPQTNYYVCQYMDKAEQFIREIE